MSLKLPIKMQCSIDVASKRNSQIKLGRCCKLDGKNGEFFFRVDFSASGRIVSL